MDKSRLVHDFNHHPPKNDGIVALHQAVRERCLQLAEFIDEILPDSREKSLAVTNLEQTMYWTNAGVARILNYRSDSQES
jgi:hypothetical protein